MLSRSVPLRTDKRDLLGANEPPPVTFRLAITCAFIRYFLNICSTLSGRLRRLSGLARGVKILSRIPALLDFKRGFENFESKCSFDFRYETSRIFLPSA
jgi:hypothetical protein